MGGAGCYDVIAHDFHIWCFAFIAMYYLILHSNSTLKVSFESPQHVQRQNTCTCSNIRATIGAAASDGFGKTEEVEGEYRAGKVIFQVWLRFCLTCCFFNLYTLGDLTESGYRKRKLKLEKAILKRDYEEGMLS